ncbi:MAG: hypothetical protein R3F46_14625 [bacterium]
MTVLIAASALVWVLLNGFDPGNRAALPDLQFAVPPASAEPQAPPESWHQREERERSRLNAYFRNQIEEMRTRKFTGKVAEEDRERNIQRLQNTCDRETDQSLTPVWDRREVAYLIITALNSYHDDNDSYPPFLLGGGNDNSILQQVANQDPLIAGGYLLDYPPYYPEPDYCYCSNRCWPFDERDNARWLCMYSTPGDYFEHGLSQLKKAVEDNGDPDFRDVRYDKPEADGRLYALGGRYHRFASVSSRSNYSFWPGRFVDTEYLLRGTHGPYVPLRNFPFFGYQRGEWLGSNESSAWLWFYGDNRAAANSEFTPNPAGSWEWVSCIPTKESGMDQGQLDRLTEIADSFPLYEPQGLDLLNAANGELQPDGIPDGICLLYKLQDGRLVESIAAQGLN